MAKVKPKPTSITRLSLKDARPRLIEVLGSPAFAEMVLIKWCAERKVRWGSKGIAGRIIIPEGMTQKQASDAAQHELWTETNPPKLNWEESSAFKAVITMEDRECTGFTVYGIWVVAEDIEVQLLAFNQKSASPTAPTEAPASASASTPTSTSPLAPTKSKLTCYAWVFGAVEKHPRPPGIKNYATYLQQFAPQDWNVRTISNEIPRVEKAKKRAHKKPAPPSGKL